MGAVPGWLLRHRVTIEPFAGVWGQFGPPVTGVRCAKSEKLGTAQQQAGVFRYSTVDLVFRLDVDCPEGSRITLADGRVGYAPAVARHESGLPAVPDHLAVSFTSPAPSYGAPLGGEMVVILRRVADGQDRYNNTRWRTEETPVDGAAVRVLSSNERPDGGGSSTTTNIEVILPPGTALTSNDRLRVRGLVFEVDGEPEVEHDPMTGGRPGVRVIAHRVAG